MKVIVLDTFRSRDNYDKVFAKGDEAEFDEERAKALIERGLVASKEVAKPTQEATPKAETAEAVQGEQMPELFPQNKKTRKSKD